MSFVGTLKTDVLGAIKTYTQKKLAENVALTTVMDRFAAKFQLPKHEGDTVRIVRPLLLPIVTEDLTAGNAPSSPTKKFKTTYADVPLKRRADFVEVPSPEIDMTAFFDHVQEVRKAQNDQIARSLDYWTIHDVQKRLAPFRVDWNPDYQGSGTCTSAGTTTTAVCTSFTQADNHWNGGFIFFTAQTANLGAVRHLNGTWGDASGDGWTNGTHTFKWSDDEALIAATSTSDTFFVAVGTGIGATDIMTTTGLLKLKRTMIDNGAHPWQIITKGKNTAPIFIMVLDSAQEEDMYADEKFSDKVIHQAGQGDLDTGAFARHCGFDFVRHTANPYRETAAGVYSATGDVHVAFAFGKNAYGVTRLAGYGRSPDAVVIEFKKDPAPNTAYWTMGWTVYRAVVAVAGFNGIRWMTGASS